MCGFYGFVGRSNFSSDRMNSIGDNLNHRGPDDKGVLLKSYFGLGFRRLSIVDLSLNGHQPMSLNGEYHIVFNGEIYNDSDLRDALLKKDYIFKGHSDSEVLLNYLAADGVSILNSLNGMFAFCFINEKQGKFYLCRDRLGVKPLFYSIYNNVLYFASELPTLLAFGIPKEINLVALNKYIRFGNIASPETIYTNIFKLNPGSFIEGSLNQPTDINIKKWYNLPLEETPIRDEKILLDELDELLFDATKIRIARDVRTGIFLSGGIDSSLVAHYSSAQKSVDKPIAISVIYDDKDFNEYEIAKAVADDKKLELIALKLNKNLGFYNLDRVFENVGEPFSDSSIINQYHLAKEAKKFATVFLTGDGGDEAFAGYMEYIRSFRFDWRVNIASKVAKYFYSPMSFLFRDDRNLKQQLSKLSVGPKYLGSAIRMNFNEPFLTQIINEEFRVKDSIITEQVFAKWDESVGLPLVKRMQHFDYNFYLEPDVLVKVDRATMANSVEARSPFLDYRIVELGLSIPNSQNIKGLNGKVLLRELAKRHLPASVFNAPKKGFGIPLKSWITQSMKDDLLLLIKENGHNFWNQKILNKVISNSDKKGNDMETLFWRIWMFELWHKQSKILN
jgi:asparagine synthase (glutamine-hydrolysing)